LALPAGLGSYFTDALDKAVLKQAELSKALKSFHIRLIGQNQPKRVG
jgi:hypothetical protein